MGETGNSLDRNQSWQEPEPTLRKRKGKPGMWEARYRRYLTDGTVERPREELGSELEFPNKADVKKSARYTAFVQRINLVRNAVFLRDLARVYREEHTKNKRRKVQYSYNRNSAYLVDKWGDLRLDQLVTKGLKIQQWLESDEMVSARYGTKLSFRTRSHIRVLLSQMLTFAVKRGDLPYNPFQSMRLLTTGGARPVDRDFYITPEQFRWLQLDPKTHNHVKMMQLVAYCLGLRGNEFLALRWENIDFDGPEPMIHIKESVVGQDIQPTKTVASEAKLPMCDLIGAALLCYKDEYPPVNGWVFGSEATEEKRPFWLGMLQKKHLRPALLRMAAQFKLKEVPKGTGWHAFRHTYRALMDELNSPLEVQQRLMRHADEAMTKHYGKHGWAMNRRMRQVQSDVTEFAMTGTGVN